MDHLVMFVLVDVSEYNKTSDRCPPVLQYSKILSSRPEPKRYRTIGLIILHIIPYCKICIVVLSGTLIQEKSFL